MAAPVGSAPELPHDLVESDTEPGEYPDLSSVSQTELRKVPEPEAVARELNGDLYAPSFRQLQIKQDRYHEFYNGVIRATRSKHQTELRRGSIASIKSATNSLLRAFGYIIWKPGSDWLIGNEELKEGEARLEYRKGKSEHVDDRYVAVLLMMLMMMMFSRLQITDSMLLSQSGSTRSSNPSGIRCGTSSSCCAEHILPVEVGGDLADQPLP